MMPAYHTSSFELVSVQCINKQLIRILMSINNLGFLFVTSRWPCLTLYDLVYDFPTLSYDLADIQGQWVASLHQLYMWCVTMQLTGWPLGTVTLTESCGRAVYHYICFLYVLYCKHSTPDNKVHGANMGPIWADRTQMGPMLAPSTLLSGTCYEFVYL